LCAPLPASRTADAPAQAKCEGGDERVVPPNDSYARALASQGNSTMGKMAGMADPRSGLLRNLCSVLLDAMPEVFFAENTPVAATNGSFDYLVQLMQPHYNITWAYVKASDLGFRHERKRFFCLGVKRTYALDTSCFESMERLLPCSIEPPRTALRRSLNWSDQLHALGNAVVPAASLYAFLVLTGAKVKGLPKAPTEPLALRFDPLAYKEPASAAGNPNRCSPLITAVQCATQWSTPRAGNSGASHILSERSMRDLPTQVRFEVSTPDDERGWLLNTDWVEWLMGYPAGYTRVPGMVTTTKASGAHSRHAAGKRSRARVKTEDEGQEADGAPDAEPKRQETRAERAARRAATVAA